jgi:hypothetical protein
MIDNDIPYDVQLTKLIQYSNQPVSVDTYNKITDIIKKYPEYFPWETKYNNIPKEVHDRFHLEAYGKNEFSLDNFNNDNNLGSIYQSIKDNENIERKPFTKDDLLNCLKQLEDSENKKRLREQEIIKIWNKYYKKYKLIYRK